MSWVNKEKGVFDLLEAFNNVEKKGRKSISLKIAGNGSHLESVKKRGRKAGVRR